MVGRRAGIGLATVASVGVTWWLLTSVTGIVGSARFPSPAEFGVSVNQILTRGYAGAGLAQHAVHSLKLVVMGFAGNSAPDHMDHFFALEEWMRRVASPAAKSPAGRKKR